MSSLFPHSIWEKYDMGQNELYPYEKLISLCGWWLWGDSLVTLRWGINIDIEVSVLAIVCSGLFRIMTVCYSPNEIEN